MVGLKSAALAWKFSTGGAVVSRAGDRVGRTGNLLMSKGTYLNLGSSRIG